MQAVGVAFRWVVLGCTGVFWVLLGVFWVLLGVLGCGLWGACLGLRELGVRELLEG